MTRTPYDREITEKRKTRSNLNSVDENYSSIAPSNVIIADNNIPYGGYNRNRDFDVNDVFDGQTVNDRITTNTVGYNEDDVVRDIRGYTGIDVFGNPLNEFYNYTYNWRLFLTSPSELYSKFSDDLNLRRYTEFLRADDPLMRQVTLAETGSTGLNIKSVEIENMIAPNQPATVLDFFITMTEPYGTVFFDKMIAAAVSLGVENWRLMPFHLELTFKGYNESGMPIQLPLKRYYPIVILDVKVDINEGGSTYTIMAKPASHLVWEQKLNLLKSSTTVMATTVGEALDEIVNSMTSKWENEPKDFYRTQHDYQYVFHPHGLSKGLNDAGISEPDPRKWKLVKSSEVDVKPIMSSSVELEYKDKTIIHIHNKTPFEDIVNALIASTVEGRLLLGITKEDYNVTGTQADSARTESKNTNQTTITDPDRNDFQLIRVDPEMTYESYNRLRGDYNKLITFHVHFFETPVVIHDRRSIDYKNTKEGQDKRRSVVFKRIKKQYEYIYTGLNTEVLSFDINMNFLWQSTMSLMGGIYSYSLVRDGERIYSKKWDTVKRAKAIQAYQETKKKLTQMDDVFESSSIEENPPTGEELTRYGDLRNQLDRFNQAFDEQNITPEGETELINDRLNQGIFDGQNFTEDGDRALSQLQKNRQTRVRQAVYQRAKYAEDLNGDTQAAIDWFALNSGTGIPQMFDEDYGESDRIYQQMVESEVSMRGKSLVSSLANQIYDQGTTKDFLNISMEIRGDPWWLGPDPYTQRIIRSQNTGTIVINGGINAVPNVMDHSHLMIMRFTFPDGYDENGLASTNHDNFFEGVYQVLKVKNKFTDGSFTQTLECVRDTMTSLPLIRAAKSRIDFTIRGRNDTSREDGQIE